MCVWGGGAIQNNEGGCTYDKREGKREGGRKGRRGRGKEKGRIKKGGATRGMGGYY